MLFHWFTLMLTSRRRQSTPPHNAFDTPMPTPHQIPALTAEFQPQPQRGPGGKKNGGNAGMPPRPERPDRVVDGHEHDLRVGRDDGDDLRGWRRRVHHDDLRRRRRGLDGDDLLRVAGEVARRLRLLPEELDGIHHLAGLREERIAQVAHPRGLLAQHCEHLRKRDQRLHARVPRLVLYGLHRGVTLEMAVRERPIDGKGDIRRIGGRHQHLRQQRIGEERDGREHLVEFRGRERGRLGGTHRRRREHASEHDDHCVAQRAAETGAEGGNANQAGQGTLTIARGRPRHK